jgi:hypothetical protein
MVQISAFLESTRRRGTNMEEDWIDIIDPRAMCASKRVGPAPRKYDSLDYRCVGLLDNSKPNADRFLGYVGELLKKRYEGVEIVSKRKMSSTEAECLPELIDKCDFIVNAFAD